MSKCLEYHSILHIVCPPDWEGAKGRGGWGGEKEGEEGGGRGREEEEKAMLFRGLL